MRRIRGLLALSGSPNQHEAEAALARAQELALKHHIALSQTPDEARRYTHRLLDRPRKRWPRYTWVVLSTCEELHDVRYIRWATPSGASVVELTGTPEDLDLAEYTYHYLLHSGDAAWQHYREARGLENNRACLTFLQELFVAFDEKLARQRQEILASEALVFHPDPKLEAAFRERHPRIRSASATGFQYDPEAGAAGAEAGARLQINPGLNKGAGGDEGQRPRGLLSGA
ncbi:MAG: DUF2786 domain-containing protein [Deltaproteobacteria bacterium]|nr:DUF2786 domain-containing protein [Deltaproteobacteria bacterium]